MPIADAPQFAFKYVNGHPNNTHRGLLTVLAFGVLADVATGAPRLLSELTITTDSRRRALIGNGAQSEFQALAFRDLVGITELRLFDVDPAVTAKLVANLAGHGLVLRRCDSADIVTTMTADKTHATIVAPDRVAPGMHFNAVGGDCPGETDLHRGVLEAASMFVEFEPQTRI